MTRRLIRTGLQFTVIGAIVFFLIVFLDNRYRVLPNALHNHLPAHHPGFVVTDVNVLLCSRLNLFGQCQITEEYWHKIDKDLYLGEALFSKAYLHVQRKREEELQATEDLVLNIHIGPEAPVEEKALGKNEKWESRPLGIWLKRSSKRHLSDAKAVTGVDVLFGLDAADPRSNWQLSKTPLTTNPDNPDHTPYLTIRNGPAIVPDVPIPRIRKDGQFKILQAADLHLTTGYGTCRDPIPDDNGPHLPPGPCQADLRTLTFLESILVSEQPDLVILSGDQINDGTVDAQSTIYKYAALFTKHKIPYAGIFGNHDDESNLDRHASMNIMDGLPYSLSTAGPADLPGVGNYYIEILQRGSGTASALTVYLLDSHSYTPDEKTYKGYDWIKDSQIEWFRHTAQSLKKKHKDYSHIHMNLAFIHIPLPEMRDNPSKYNIVGEFRETSTAPLYNSGFAQALIDEDVKFVSCGHDHANDFCVPMDGERHVTDASGEVLERLTKKPALWMCHAGGAGFGGYGGYNEFVRRVRLFEFDMNLARIKTWKRLEAGTEAQRRERVDESVIVDGGEVVVGV